MASIRFTGTSGIDVDSIVKQLMTARKSTLNKLNQQKTTLEWTQQQYRDINIKLVDFRNNKLFNYGLQGSINAKQANVTGNTTAVSAKANAGAISGTMTVEVDALATAATLKSRGGGLNKTLDPSKSLSDLKAAGLINYKKDADGNITFKLSNGANSDTITLNESGSLSSLITTINGSKANVNAFLDSQTGQMSFSSKNTGAGEIKIDSDASGFLANFQLTDSTPGKDTVGLKINGIAVTRSSNVFTENGVEITLNGPTGGVKSSISVVSNTDKIIETIKSFITDYNDVLNTVNNKINEERYRKYPPLTSEQKEEMKDSEIELWESKAKSGLLRNDSTLSKLSSDLRLSMITDVNIGGTKVNLTSLGITTGEWSQRGKLAIQDEAKLRAAIEANPDQVLALFTQQSSASDPAVKASPSNPDNGLFNRLSNVLMSALDGLASKAGTSKYSTDANASFLTTSSISTSLRLLDIRIDDENDRLDRLEAQYYKQFSAMETAMSRYSAQAGSLFGASN
ncbi:flagellar hook-associated protein 2 [Cohnella xylanilytica]|uniref:flagellar filament capping protein FliD n=1 Tax=Cohnella xylanilytica TaxID=557555 RepID=UPI001B0728D5|nr:flagellar filament capping protein FliD [Cohnella xylanilytica]GIO12285.1 flagellar hook-associated protein 2 [Cohnella xylanilytica]